MEAKKCMKCGEIKNLLYFSKNKTKKLGISNVCKKCHSKYRHEHYLKNKEKVLKQVKEYNKNNYKDGNKTITPNKKSGRIFESICPTCGERTYRTKKDLNNNKHRFCSRECASINARKPAINFQFRHIKAMAKKRSKEFNITLDYINDLMKKQNNRCAITNVPIVVNSQRDTTCIYETASLDRKDSNKGYVKGNVQWVLLGINYMKRNFKDEDVHKLMKLIIENYNASTNS